MTQLEKRLFIGLLGFGGLLIVVLISVSVYAMMMSGVENTENTPKIIQPTEKPTVRLNDTARENALHAFYKKIAPIEVGPVHRAVEPFLTRNFSPGIKYSYESFENSLRPLLEAYFRQWYIDMANAVLSEMDQSHDVDLLDEMTSSAHMEDKVHFMLLYEQIFLKNGGILIETQK